jgi:hypothetical protein
MMHEAQTDAVLRGLVPLSVVGVGMAPSMSERDYPASSLLPAISSTSPNFSRTTQSPNEYYQLLAPCGMMPVCVLLRGPG